jgi:hypothetical protein
MTWGFADIPEVLIDYVRGVFAVANDKVSKTMDAHPSMHEESLDHILIMELSAAPLPSSPTSASALPSSRTGLGGVRCGIVGR